jgi:hypothetical protein
MLFILNEPFNSILRPVIVGYKDREEEASAPGRMLLELLILTSFVE